MAVNPIDDETWEAFKESCERLLPGIETGLLDIETLAPGALPGHLAMLMRQVHTLKGDAGIVRLSKMMELCHAMETLIGAIDANPALARPSIVNMLLSGLDKLRAMAERPRAAQSVDIERELDVLDLASGRLRESG